jgi:DNA-binding protein HU-beta
MTKSQLLTHLSEETELPKKKVAELLEVLAETAYSQAKNGFTLPGLGKLVLVNRKARKGRNPATGATIKIPAKRVLKFRLAKAAKDAVLVAKKK